MISYVPKKIRNINIVVWSCCSKRLLSGIHYFVIFICDSPSQLVMVQTSKEKVPHIHKEYEIYYWIWIFVYEKLLLSKSPQNKASNIGITRENEKTSDISYMPGAFSDKVIDLKWANSSLFQQLKIFH